MEKEEKKKLLSDLKRKMQQDISLPLRKGATNLVFGEGNVEAKIMFIGEGPGYFEDQKGEPFVGSAGLLLNQLLYSIKLERGDVFITNVVHHRPQNNRDPLPYEIEAYGKYLDEILEIIGPRVIVTLGRFSMVKFLPDTKITSVHGNVFKVNWKGRKVVVVPMFHPAAALRSAGVMEQIKEDFARLPEILKEIDKPEIKQMKLV